MKYDKNGTVTEKKQNKMAIALIVASSAVVLVALAIILVVIMLICKYRRAMKPVEDDVWAQRQNIQMGEAVEGEAIEDSDEEEEPEAAAPPR